jgi:hypothetical protein
LRALGENGTIRGKRSALPDAKLDHTLRMIIGTAIPRFHQALIQV